MSKASEALSSKLAIHAVSQQSNNVIVRIPVTKESLAVKIGAGTATDEEEMLFFDSISRIIYLNIHRYGYYDSRREFEDLVNETYVFFRSVLKWYDPSKAALVTWAWKVIFTRTITQRKYNDRYRKTHFLADDNPDFGISSYESPRADTPLRIDFRDAIKTLHDRMPKRKNILFELFGNPYEDNYTPPTNINFSKAARNLGISMQDVRSFCLNYVYPFLKQRFGDII